MLSNKLMLLFKFKRSLKNLMAGRKAEYTDPEFRGRFFCSKNRTGAYYRMFETFIKRPFLTLLKI